MVGCGSHPRPTTTIPLQQELKEELKKVTLEGDTSTVRLVFEQPLSGIRMVDYQQGTRPSAPIIKWSLKDNNLDVTATAPDQEVKVVERTVTKEVPVEVEVVRVVNKLHWWQETLMWCGSIALLLLLIKVARRITNY